MINYGIHVKDGKLHQYARSVFRGKYHVFTQTMDWNGAFKFTISLHEVRMYLGVI